MLGTASVAYEVLTRATAAAGGPDSAVARAVRGSRKGLISVAVYAVAAAILLRTVPDRRMGRAAAAP